MPRRVSKRVTKRSSDSQTSEESTPKKTKVTPSPRRRKAVSKKITRLSPRINKLSTSPSKTLLEKRRAAREEHLETPSPLSKRTPPNDDLDISLDYITPKKRNKYEKLNDVFNFRYEDKVVVPSSPILPSLPVFKKFSPSPSLPLPLGQPTDAMRAVATNAELRRGRGRNKKKHIVQVPDDDDDDDELEIISIVKTPKAKTAKRKTTSNDPLSNPTSEMIKVMHSQGIGRRKK
ncbi:hypothetical protein LOD99_473 [Oopsacas minuta]|uniref:Uncharacterized protein n=1 Tax=Oopsacas minuta TaxID=111878 RepID=A0AAV7KAU7_9METZ|nr:hypothetical protein LOD99_473 [Oopsacas minuta]